MKKIILLFVLSVSLFSCSKDDAKTTYTNKIVGTWKSSMVTQKNLVTNEIVDQTPICPTEVVYTGASSESSTSILLTAGSFTQKNSAKNANNVCELTNTYTGSWTDQKDGTYAVSLTGQTFQEELGVSFSADGKTLTFTNVDGPYLFTQKYIKQ